MSWGYEERVRRILVNASNVTGAGARSSTLQFAPALTRAMPQALFSLVLPDQPDFRSLPLPSHARAIYVPRPRGLTGAKRRLQELFLTVPQLARQTKADVCLTLGDLGAIGLPCPQVVLLRQPLLVYDRREMGGLAGWHPIKGWYLAWHFGLSARRSAYVVVQTPVMAERLARRYGLDRRRIVVIPQALLLEVAPGEPDSSGHPVVSACAKSIKLLFLAAYYPHKNHAILPAVAAEIKRRRLESQVQIFLTLDSSEMQRARLGDVLRPHADVVTNLGRLSRSEVAPALRASTALFLPTLLESYGNIYLEALACGRRILTSDRDFARWMCRGLALYFDPLNAVSIVDAIEALPKTSSDDEAYAAVAGQHLSTFPRDWDEVAARFAEVLAKCLPTSASSWTPDGGVR